MATKKPNIAELVDKSMSGRNISSPDNAQEESKGKRFKPTPKQSVLIRLDEGDYRTLQRIAEEKGTKASALIRQKVKEIIKEEGGILK
jgi:16S rRNA U516 pseudouridylate synthase RsuA-like enzyme